MIIVQNRTTGAATVPMSASSFTIATLSIPFTPKFIEVTLAAGFTDGVVHSQVVQSSISTAGFTVNFSTLIPSANYVIGWQAFA